MILADKIIDLRKKNGWSQEELAEKLGVSRQSVSKWEGAQSVPDMGRVVQLSELFGVSTDYLLKDSLGLEESAPAGDEDGPVRALGMEEANDYLRIKEINARHVALGVLLCILSPIWVILLCGGQEFGLLSLSAGQAAGLGVAALLLTVGGAVALFVTSALRVSRYSWLDSMPVDTLYGVDGMTRERMEQFRPTRNLQLTLGIVLCVLSVIPVFLSILFFGEGESFAHLVAVCALLVLVAVGVLLIVRSSILWGACQRLLEEGDYSRESKEAARRAVPFSGIYWSLVTAGFLAWGFLGNAWDRCWIIWPVAGVAFGAIYGIVSALRKK